MRRAVVLLQIKRLKHYGGVHAVGISNIHTDMHVWERACIPLRAIHVHTAFVLLDGYFTAKREH